MSTATTLSSALAVAASLAACAVPTTQLGSISLADVRAEQLKQQQLAIQWDLRQQQRVEDVGHALLAAAAPLCNGPLAPRTGIRFANVYSFSKEYRPAASALGFSDTLVVVGVARGSAAERAGFTAGDRIVAADGGAAPSGPNAIQQLTRILDVRRVPAVNLTLLHGDTRFLSDDVMDTTGSSKIALAARDAHVSIPADTVCAYNLVALRKDELNAYSDGSNVIVTSAMLRFAADDDELATVLAHEIAHNAMRHIQAQQKNATLGGLFGAIIDIAAATQGVNTQGEFTKHGIDIGSTVFSQDFEREADYVGMYLLARARRSTAKAPNLWRHMAQENPGSIKFATTHPTTAERFVRLAQAAAEIADHGARGEDLMPEMRNGPTPTRANATRALASGSRTPARSPSAPPTRSPEPAKVDAKAKPQESERAVAMVESPGILVTTTDSVPVSYTTLSKLSKKDSASYTFGPAAPRNGLSTAQARRRAVRAYQDGHEALEVRLYDQAEAKFREAVLYDGGEAKYHAALGELLLKRGKLAAAEAALSAAVLLDMENPRYRQLLAEARRRP